MRNITRSFEPIETKSASGSTWSSSHSSDGTSIMAPSSSFGGDVAAARASALDFLVDDPRGCRGTPRLGDHRHEDLHRPAIGGLKQRADLDAQQARPVERQAGASGSPWPGSPRPPSADRGSPCRRRYRAGGRRSACPAAAGWLRHRARPARSSRGSLLAIMNCSSVRNSPTPSAPVSSSIGRSATRPELCSSVIATPSRVTDGLSLSSR